VVSAVEGIAEPVWGYHGPATSTGGAAVFMIINGPIAPPGFNCEDNLFGPGWRANATWARGALGDAQCHRDPAGPLDRGTIGNPGKYTYVIAENEAESPGRLCTSNAASPPARAR
jgi:hypothetical protein